LIIQKLYTEQQAGHKSKLCQPQSPR